MEAIRFEKVCFSYQTGGSESTDGDIFSTDASFSLDGIDLSV